jgi:uncharacterized membrane protein
MSESNDRPFFRATLTPYRSLSPNGFLILMAFIIAVSFSAGFAFWLMGAWPVVGFFGLDIAAVYFAFWLNYRSALAYEEVELSERSLTIKRVMPNGEEESWSFHPHWSRLEIERSEWGVRAMRIVSHGKTFLFGRFLNPDDRASFAKALGEALAELRAGRTAR